MPLATKAELSEIAAELRVLAATAETVAKRDLLTCVAERYAAMAAESAKSLGVDLDHGRLRRAGVECALSRRLPGTSWRS